MTLPASGTLSLKDILDEKQLGTTARTNISLRGLSVDGVDDSSGGDITGTPNSATPHQVSEFYSYSQTTFNGAGPGNSTFSFTSGVKPASNHPDFNMDINGTEKGSTFWEMQHNRQNANSPAVQANAVASINIARDETNKRILILLLKDGDNSTLAGNNGNAGYKILPYVGLENATWSFKFEYDTSDSEYNSTTGNPNVFQGNPTGFGSATTDTSFFTVPSNPGTFQSLNGGTGLAENGESVLDISRNQLVWTAKVASNINNKKVGVGTTSVFSGSIPCRLVIKAVLGTDTYTSTSNYWKIGLTASRVVVF